MNALRSEFVFELTADLGAPQPIGETRNGTRMIFPVTGGRVTGPRGNGKVLPFGADWILIGSDGVGRLDVRATLEMDDGAFIYAYYPGFLNVSPDVMGRINSGESVDPGEYYFRTTPTIETSAEKYADLTQRVLVGVGDLRPQQVHYAIYAIL